MAIQKKQTERSRKNVQALIGAVLVAALTAFAIELSAGHIIVSPDYAWAIPVLVASISAATPQLRGIFFAVKGEEPADPPATVAK